MRLKADPQDSDKTEGIFIKNISLLGECKSSSNPPFLMNLKRVNNEQGDIYEKDDLFYDAYQYDNKVQLIVDASEYYSEGNIECIRNNERFITKKVNRGVESVNFELGFNK